MLIKTEVIEGRIFITSPYNADFIAKVKNIGGRWNAASKQWSVPEENSDLLNDLLNEIFGTAVAGSSGEKIKVRYKASDFEPIKFTDIRIGNAVMVSRRLRDNPVTFNHATIVASGKGFPSSGGSNGYPKPAPFEDTILQSELPVEIYNALEAEDKEKLTVVDSEADRTQSLENEKAKLLARLAEIEKELGGK